MGMTLSEIKTDCFCGERDRDCKSCPAHKSRGGDCCFGRLHEYNDPSENGCQSCIHEKDCARLTHGSFQPHSQTRFPNASRIIINRGVPQGNPRIPITSNTTPRYSSTTHHTPQRITEGCHYGELLRENGPIAYEPLELSEDVTMLEKFGLVTGWGAAEGGLELALHFMRKHRPDP